MDKDPIIRQYPINVHKLFCLTLLLVLAMFYGVMDRLAKINSNLKKLESIEVEVEVTAPVISEKHLLPEYFDL